jgi:hypothetical protein
MERVEKQLTAVEWLAKNLKDFPHVKHSQLFRDLVEQAKQIEKAEKIKAQIELLEHLNLNWDLEGIHPGKEDYLVEIKWLKTKLKELELTFKSE